MNNEDKIECSRRQDCLNMAIRVCGDGGAAHSVGVKEASVIKLADSFYNYIYKKKEE